MTKFIKRFPLTTYAILVLILFLVTKENMHPDNNFIIFIILWFLMLPLTAVNQVMVLFGITNKILLLYSPVFLFFLLDLFLLYFCNTLVPKLKSRFKS